MGDINDDKLRELGEKLALFAEDGPIQWPVAPFQMHPVVDFVPSPAALLQAQQQQQLFQQQFGGYAAAAPYYPPGPAAFQVLAPNFVQPTLVAKPTESPFLAGHHPPTTTQFKETTACSPKHQRVPSLGAIDSETNPIAASLLMSFKSVMNDDCSTSKSAEHLPQPPQQPQHHHHQQQQQQQQPKSRVEHHSNNSHHSGYNGGGKQQQQQQQHHHAMMKAHHYYSNDFNNAQLTQQQQQNLPPPPPPPVQLPQQVDCWSPYNGSVQCSDQGASSRPKFSDVVKKSLSEVASGQPGANSSTGGSQSRPVTPAPTQGSQVLVGSSSQPTTSVPPSPSLGGGQVVVIQTGGMSLPNANFSLASSRSNLSRNGKPIVVAKVEPMQVSANRLAAQQQQQQQQQQQNQAKPSGVNDKVRRTRSSTTGNSGISGNTVVEGGGNNQGNQGQFGGSIDSVFDPISNGNSTANQKGKSDQSNRRGGAGHGRMVTTSSMESHDSDEGELLEFEDTTDEMIDGDSSDQITMMMRQRSNTAQRHQQTKSKKAAPKRGVKAAETGSSRPALFFLKLGAFLAQLGPWLVFFLAKTGAVFRFMLYLVVQGLGFVLGVVFDAIKSCYNVVRRLFPEKVERAELKLSYLALLRQYGLPRPISLPGSADATLKRLVQLADADAYTVLGCRFDAKQDDINVRLRQLARLLTQNHKKTQQLEEAGAVFRRICNDIGSREARQRYDCELVASAEYALKRRAAHHYHQSFKPLASLGLGGLLAFQCYDCGLIHQFFEVSERRQSESRACNRCGPTVLHGCDLNDLWAESLVSTTTTTSNLDVVGGGDSSAPPQPPDQHLRYLTCLLDPAVVYDVSDVVPCCKLRFLAKFKLDPNCHSVAYKLELSPKFDEQGLPMRKLPNPTAIQQADGDRWSTLQVYQVRMVTKFKHDNNSSFNNNNVSSSSSNTTLNTTTYNKQYDSSKRGGGGGGKNKKQQ